MDEANYMGLMVFGLLFLWSGYPFIIMKLRPKVFKGMSTGIMSCTNLFLLYCFIIGFTTSIGTFIILSLFNSNTVSLDGMIRGFLVGLIAETIILFPDKLQKIFKINLRSTKYARKFILIYLLLFITIMSLIDHFLL